MNSACEAGLYSHLTCVGHALHNLVLTDGIKKTESIFELLKNVRAIVKALRYRVSEFERLCKDQLHLAEEMSRYSDYFFPFEDEEMESEDEKDTYDENVSENSGTKAPRSKTLKLDVKTRWHSALMMIESLLSQNKSVINLMLQKTDHPELVLSNSDYRLLNELSEFLQPFQKITAIFSGEKYATLNYYMLFRQEIQSLIDTEPKDSYEIKSLKKNMLEGFEKRFPLSEKVILAALLDPRFQNLLDVKCYLHSHRCASAEFLIKGANEVINNNNTYHEANCAEYNSLTPQIVRKNNTYIDELTEKHSTLSSLAKIGSDLAQTDLERECYMLLSMSGKVELTNILTFWKENSKLMPKLSTVARSTYCIPATSTPSERVFSIAGLTINNKRSQLSPNNLDHIIFIHDNYTFVKDKVNSIVNFE